MLTGLTNLDMAAGQRDVYGEVDDLGRDGARWRMWFGESSLRRWPRASLDPGALFPTVTHRRVPHAIFHHNSPIITRRVERLLYSYFINSSF